MSLIPFERSRKLTLDELFSEARSFGLVTLHTSDDGRYWAKIKFATITNTKLEAESPFSETPHQAFTEAIEAAKKVKEHFK